MNDEGEERYRPGLLDLNLQLSSIKNVHHLQYQLHLTDKLLTEFEGFKETTCAILNLKGTVLFFLKEYQKASDTFKEVLKHDDSNLNALSNLESIYRQLGYWTKADQYHSQLEEDDHLLNATCFGEQGFAMMFDCHISVDEYARFKRSKNMFELCFRELKNVDAGDGCLQWYLWYAQLLHKLLNKCTTGDQRKEKVECLREGLKCCLHVRDNLKDIGESSSDKDKHLLSVAIAYLGIFAHKVSSDIKEEVEKEFSVKLGEILSEPETAFKSADELHQNTEVLCRYALYLQGNDSEDKLKNLQKAEKLIDKAITLDKSGHGNWFPFTIKSSIILGKCRLRRGQSTREISDQDINHKVLDSTMEEWLQESIEFGERAAEINATPKIYSDLGEAYHWRAMNQKQTDLKEGQTDLKEGYFFTALSQFCHALNHADGNKLPYIHYNHGKCLMEMEQFYPAIESFKRAIECQTKRPEQAYSELITCYLKVLSNTEHMDGTSKPLNREHLLSDLAYWINLGNEIFVSAGNASWLDDILNKVKGTVGDNISEASEIENIFAVIARLLMERKSFPVSDKYLKENISFTLNVFGQILQLKNVDYRNTCLAIVDDREISDLNDEKQCVCLNNLVASWCMIHEKCKSSSMRDCLREEKFLIDTFECLHKKCPHFAEKVAFKIQKNNYLFGHILLENVGEKTLLTTDDIELHAKNVSLRELCFYAKQLHSSEETCTEKIKDCMAALEKCVEDMSCQEPAAGDSLVSRPKVRDKRYHYDFAVIYTETDSKWVVHSLLPTLERKYGFRGFIENRDLSPGQSRFKSIYEFENCYKVIVILSDHFTQDEWCSFIFKQALYDKLGKQSIIPVQKGRLKEVPKELQTIISLTVVQNFDWERLVRELEE